MTTEMFNTDNVEDTQSSVESEGASIFDNPEDINLFDDPTPSPEPETEVEDNPGKPEQSSELDELSQDEPGPETEESENSDKDEDNPLDIPEDMLPSKYKGKTREDVIEMHQNAEKMLGKFKGREKDFELLDILVDKANSNPEAARMLDAIVSDKLDELTKQSKEQPSDSSEYDSFEDEEYLSDSDKEIRDLKGTVQKLTEMVEGLTKQQQEAKPAIEHSQKEVQQQKELKMMQDAVGRQKTRLNVEISPKELYQFAEKYHKDYQFTSWHDAASTLAAIKVRKLDSARRETSRKKRAEAPNVAGKNTPADTTPDKTYGSWDDLKKTIAATLSKS